MLTTTVSKWRSAMNQKDGLCFPINILGNNCINSVCFDVQMFTDVFDFVCFCNLLLFFLLVFIIKTNTLLHQVDFKYMHTSYIHVCYNSQSLCTKQTNRKREHEPLWSDIFFVTLLLVSKSKIRPKWLYVENPFMPAGSKLFWFIIDKCCYLFNFINVHCSFFFFIQATSSAFILNLCVLTLCR